MSHVKTLYHIVIRTYRNQFTINEEHERELYAYIFGICKQKKSQIIQDWGNARSSSSFCFTSINHGHFTICAGDEIE